MKRRITSWMSVTCFTITLLAAPLVLLQCGGNDKEATITTRNLGSHSMFKEVNMYLTVRDIRLTMDFYKELGFASATYRPAGGAPKQATIRAGNVVINLQSEDAVLEQFPDLTPFPAPGAVKIELIVANVDELFDEIKLTTTIVEEPNQPEPGYRQFVVSDPDGYLIVLKQPMGEKISM